MFYSRVFHNKKDVVLAVCDKELMGKTIKGDGVEIDINEFYGEEVVDERYVVDFMGKCTIANLMGSRIVSLAKRHGFITEENVISIGEVPHAQFIKI